MKTLCLNSFIAEMMHLQNYNSNETFHCCCCFQKIAQILVMTVLMTTSTVPLSNEQMLQVSNTVSGVTDAIDQDNPDPGALVGLLGYTYYIPTSSQKGLIESHKYIYFIYLNEAQNFHFPKINIQSNMMYNKYLDSSVRSMVTQVSKDVQVHI